MSLELEPARAPRRADRLRRASCSSSSSRQGAAVRERDVEARPRCAWPTSRPRWTAAPARDQPHRAAAAGRRRARPPRAEVTLEALCTLMTPGAAELRPPALRRAARPARRDRPRARHQPRADAPGARLPRPPDPPIGGEPEGAYAPAAPARAARPPARRAATASWTCRPSHADLHLLRPADRRCAACSPTSARSTSPATTSPTPTRRATRARRPSSTAAPALHRPGRRGRRRRGRAARRRRRRPGLPPHPRRLPRRPVPRAEHAPRLPDRRPRRVLQDAETALAEPGDDGIAAQLANFWDAWSTVANDAERPGRPPGARRAGQDPGRRVRDLDGQLTQLADAAAAEYASLTGARTARSHGDRQGDRPAQRRDPNALQAGVASRTTCSTAATCCSTSSPSSAQVSVTAAGQRHDHRRLRRRGHAARRRHDRHLAAGADRARRPARRAQAADATRTGRSTPTADDLNAFANKLADAVNDLHGSPPFFTFTDGAGGRDARRRRHAPPRSSRARRPTRAPTTSPSASPTCAPAPADAAYRTFVARIGADVNAATREQANAAGADRVRRRPPPEHRRRLAGRGDDQPRPLPARLPGVGALDVHDRRDARPADQPHRTGRAVSTRITTGMLQRNILADLNRSTQRSSRTRSASCPRARRSPARATTRPATARRSRCARPREHAAAPAQRRRRPDLAGRHRVRAVEHDRRRPARPHAGRPGRQRRTDADRARGDRQGDRPAHRGAQGAGQLALRRALPVRRHGDDDRPVRAPGRTPTPATPAPSPARSAPASRSPSTRRPTASSAPARPPATTLLRHPARHPRPPAWPATAPRLRGTDLERLDEGLDNLMTVPAPPSAR